MNSQEKMGKARVFGFCATPFEADFIGSYNLSFANADYYIVIIIIKLLFAFFLT